MRALSRSEQSHVAGGRQFNPIHAAAGAGATPDLKKGLPGPGPEPHTLPEIYSTAFIPVPDGFSSWFNWDMFNGFYSDGPSEPAEGVNPPAGGGGAPDVQDAELLRGAAEELEAAALGGDIPSDWVAAGVDVADLAEGALYDNYVGGEASWNMYKATGSGVNSGLAYVNTPIDWNHVDWSQIPGASTATTYADAMQDLANYAASVEN